MFSGSQVLTWPRWLKVLVLSWSGYTQVSVSAVLTTTPVTKTTYATYVLCVDCFCVWSNIKGQRETALSITAAPGSETNTQVWFPPVCLLGQGPQSSWTAVAVNVAHICGWCVSVDDHFVSLSVCEHVQLVCSCVVFEHTVVWTPLSSTANLINGLVFIYCIVSPQTAGKHQQTSGICPLLPLLPCSPSYIFSVNCCNITQEKLPYSLKVLGLCSLALGWMLLSSVSPWSKTWLSGGLSTEAFNSVFWPNGGEKPGLFYQKALRHLPSLVCFHDLALGNKCFFM